MKNFKTKKIVLGTVMALSAVSLASVGFANWIINGIVGKDVGNIGVTIGQLTDTSVTTTMNEGSELNVAFDNYVELPKDATSIFGNDDNKKEDLKFQLNFRVATTGEAKISTLVDQVTFKFTQSKGFADSITANYIVSPFGNAKQTGEKRESSITVDLKTNSLSNPNISATESVNFKYIDVTAIFEFGWGSEFNGHNPGYTYEKDTIKADKMKENLHAFKELIGENFNASVEITPSKKTA